MRQDMGVMEGQVQITVGEALPEQLRAWTELWSKLLAPLQTENSTVADAAMDPEDSGATSASKAEQAIAEALGRSGGESAHV